MIYDPATGRLRMTRTEKADLRQAAAAQGVAVNAVTTVDQSLDLHLQALPDGIAQDLLQFLETGQSGLTSCQSVPEFEAQLRLLI